jgi:toxin ParE1/3/4
VSRRHAPVVWSPLARADLRRIAEYVRQFSPSASGRLARELKIATRRLNRFPLSGRTLPEYPNSRFRELIVRDYRVIYAYTGEVVTILTVIHGARDLPSLLGDDPI